MHTIARKYDDRPGDGGGGGGVINLQRYHIGVELAGHTTTSLLIALRWLVLFTAYDMYTMQPEHRKWSCVAIALGTRSFYNCPSPTNLLASTRLTWREWTQRNVVVALDAIAYRWRFIRDINSLRDVTRLVELRCAFIMFMGNPPEMSDMEDDCLKTGDAKKWRYLVSPGTFVGSSRFAVLCAHTIVEIWRGIYIHADMSAMPTNDVACAEARELYHGSALWIASTVRKVTADNIRGPIGKDFMKASVSPGDVHRFALDHDLVVPERDWRAVATYKHTRLQLCRMMHAIEDEDLVTMCFSNTDPDLRIAAVVNIVNSACSIHGDIKWKRLSVMYEHDYFRRRRCMDGYANPIIICCAGRTDVRFAGKLYPTDDIIHAVTVALHLVAEQIHCPFAPSFDTHARVHMEWLTDWVRTWREFAEFYADEARFPLLPDGGRQADAVLRRCKIASETAARRRSDTDTHPEWCLAVEDDEEYGAEDGGRGDDMEY